MNLLSHVWLPCAGRQRVGRLARRTRLMNPEVADAVRSPHV